MSVCCMLNEPYVPACAVASGVTFSSTYCAALKRLEERGEELAELLTAAAEAMDKILAEGQHAESKAFACIDS